MAKKNATVQDLILAELTELRSDIKKIATEKLPNILIDVAVINERSSKANKLYTVIGGAITVLLSIGTAVAVAWFTR